MGSGKTTVGKALAKKMSYTLIDTDALCEKRSDMSVSDIFAKHGEDYFRQLESTVLSDVCASNKQIIASGGGIVVADRNRALLKQQPYVVFLETTVEHQLQRVQASQTRPLLTNENPQQVLTRLYHARYKLYQEVAKYTVPTDGHSVEEITDNIMTLIAN